MTAYAEKLALNLMLALSDLEDDVRSSVERMRGRALDEAATRTDGWQELDGSVRLIRALELGMGAVCVDPVMSASPRAVQGKVSDDRLWYLLEDRPLFNCAALALMAANAGRKVMLRLESEFGIPGAWWDEPTLSGSTLVHMGYVQPIVLNSADTRLGTREYRVLASGAHMIDSVVERGSASDDTGVCYERVQSPMPVDAISAPLPGAEELARVTAPSAGQAQQGGHRVRNMLLLLLAMLACGGALYGLYSIVFRMIM